MRVSERARRYGCTAEIKHVKARIYRVYTVYRMQKSDNLRVANEDSVECDLQHWLFAIFSVRILDAEVKECLH